MKKSGALRVGEICLVDSDGNVSDFILHEQIIQGVDDTELRRSSRNHSLDMWRGIKGEWQRNPVTWESAKLAEFLSSGMTPVEANEMLERFVKRLSTPGEIERVANRMYGVAEDGS